MRLLAALGVLGLVTGCDFGPERGRETGAGESVLRSSALPEGSVRRAQAGRELPAAGPPVTPALLARGRDAYGAFCTPCHGSTGRGDGPAVKRGFPAPPSFDDPRNRDLTPARVVQVVLHGYGLMFPMADRVEPADAWAIAHHVDRTRRVP